MTKAEFKKFFRYITSVTTDINPSPEKMQVGPSLEPVATPGSFAIKNMNTIYLY